MSSSPAGVFSSEYYPCNGSAVSTVLSRVNNVTSQCLLSSLKAYWDPLEMDRTRWLADKSVDWRAWLQLIQKWQIAPLIYESLRVQEWLPPKVVSALRQAYLRNAMRNDLLLKELAALLQELAQASQIMLLKGAALVGTAYDNPSVRPMADQDLLVRPTEANVTRAALTNLGFATDGLEPWPGYSNRYRQVLEFSRPVHPGFSHSLDLHWGLVDVPYYARISVDEWFSRARISSLYGTEMRLPSSEDHFLCLCAHLALHERYKPDLIRYCDIAALVTRVGSTMRWDSVLRRASKWQLVIPLQRAISAIEEFWPNTFPNDVAQAILRLRAARGERWLHRWWIDRRYSATADVLMFAATVPGLIRKISLLLEQAVPSPAYMRHRHNCRRMWPLTYLQRAFLAVRFLAGVHR